MHSPKETVTETAGLDEQLREQYSLAAFRDLEQGTVLGRVYEFWESLPRNDSGLPVISDEHLFNGATEDSLQWMSVIDTQSDNPMEFVIQACGKRQLPEYCTDTADICVIDIPCLFHAIQLAIECLTCKHDRSAAYHVINQTIGGRRSHYARLLLPVGDAEGNVVKILHIVRPVRMAVKAKETL